MKTNTIQSILLIVFFSFVGKVYSQITDPKKMERFTKRSIEQENKGLAEPFKGITNDGKVQEGVFELNSTGISTEPIRKAAMAFMKSLDGNQQQKAKFSVDDDEWRKWMNQHFYVRQGVGFVEMSEKQRSAAFDLMRVSLSTEGLKLSKSVALNTTRNKSLNEFVR